MPGFGEVWTRRYGVDLSRARERRTFVGDCSVLVTRVSHIKFSVENLLRGRRGGGVRHASVSFSILSRIPLLFDR
jgi:hypothetical protein